MGRGSGKISNGELWVGIKRLRWVFMKEEWRLIVSVLMLMEMVTMGGWNRTMRHVFALHNALFGITSFYLTSYIRFGS